MSGLAPEMDLLRACVRSCLGEPIETAGLVHPSIRWPHVLWIGREQRVLLFLLAALERSAPSLCPPSVLAQLKDLREAGVYQRLLRGREIYRLEERFDQETIPVLSLSGWSLSERHYPDPRLRETGSGITWLIHARDRDRARAALQPMGYCFDHDPLRLSYLGRSRVEFRETLVGAQEDAGLDGGLGGPDIGIAAGVGGPDAEASAGTDAPGVWSRAETIVAAGRRIHTPAPRDWLLHLSSRIVARDRIRLRDAYDLIVVSRPDRIPDWSVLLETGSSPAGDLAVAVAAAHDLLVRRRPAPVADYLLHHPDLERRARTLAESCGASTGSALTGSASGGSAPPSSASEEAWPAAAGESAGAFTGTPPAVVDRMLRLAGTGPGDVVYDLGCGDGRIVIHAARAFGARGVGIDSDPRRIAEAEAAAKGLDGRVSFVQGDLFEIDLAPATIVCLYLEGFAYPRLAQTLTSLRPGARIVSHDFSLPGRPPDAAEIVRSDLMRTSHVYLWKVG